MEGALLFLYTETPVHPGGSESFGGIDLPIQREAATRLPVIWGETLKGSLRASLGPQADGVLGAADLERVFGSPPPGPRDEPPKPGGWAFGDARLVALPVSTLRETFAWVTSPLLLERLARLAALAGIHGLPDIPRPGADEALPAGDGWGDRVALADLDLEAGGKRDQATARWAAWLADSALPRPRGDGDVFGYFRHKLASDLLVVDDDTLTSLSDECVEVVARVQLGQTKTVKQGPWYVEYLPAETIAVSFQHRTGQVADGIGYPSLLDGRVVVLGGEETVGKGLLWCRVLAAELGGS